MPQRPSHRKLTADPARCVNCRICEMACSLAKSGMFSPAKARIWILRDQENGTDVPMICRHCREPACLHACPVDAISVEEGGGVVLDPGLCVRCYQCVAACPFKAIKIDRSTGEALKCDLCGGEPECVKWCPAAAIDFTDAKGSCS